MQSWQVSSDLEPMKTELPDLAEAQATAQKEAEKPINEGIVPTEEEVSKNDTVATESTAEQPADNVEAALEENDNAVLLEDAGDESESESIEEAAEPAESAEEPTEEPVEEPASPRFNISRGEPIKGIKHVYASDGTEIAKLHAGADSLYLASANIPDDVKNAFIAIEDKRFYDHHGVDWASTAKSCYLLVKNKSISRGGSTITQQLVRNVFTEDVGFEKSYTRKLKEILTALLLEKKYKKDQILEYYINNINFGNGYCGIGAAAVGYFGKDVSELSTAEVALLCAIPNNPTYYDPRTNLKHTLTRRNLILQQMYEQGYLDKENYLVALNSGVDLIEPATKFYNYESSYAIHCAVEYRRFAYRCKVHRRAINLYCFMSFSKEKTW